MFACGEEGDGGFDDKDGEEGGFEPDLRPDDSRSYGRDREQKREPAKPRMGELMGASAHCEKCIRVNADFEIVAEDDKLFAKIEAGPEFVDGCMALSKMRDRR